MSFTLYGKKKLYEVFIYHRYIQNMKRTKTNGCVHWWMHERKQTYSLQYQTTVNSETFWFLLIFFFISILTRNRTARDVMDDYKQPQHTRSPCETPPLFLILFYFRILDLQFTILGELQLYSHNLIS